MKYRKKVHLLFAVDDNYVPFLMTAIKSIADHSSNNYTYDITIINEGLKEQSKKNIKNVTQRKNFVIHFFNISLIMNSMSLKFDLRDYYTLTIYYRLFFPNLFPLKRKALYLDCDLVVNDDIANLYFTDLKDNLLGAVQDASVQLYPEFGTYVNKVLRLEKEKYFNSGVLLMNLEKLREFNLEGKVNKLLKKVRYKVAPDQDILNLLCKDRILYLDNAYNVMPLPDGEVFDNPKIIHYNLMFKPWNLKGIRYEEYFWEYAHKVGVDKKLRDNLNAINEDTTAKLLDGVDSVKRFCLAEAERADTYYYKAFETRKKKVTKETEIKEEVIYMPNDIRGQVIVRINKFEKEGRFNEDVELDPPFRHLSPGEVDYLRTKFTSKIKTFWAVHYANRYFNGLIKKDIIKIDGYEGLDNLKNLKSGAIITMNHFNPFDSIPLNLAFKKNKPHNKLYTVIKEGNYTFPGLYGFFMRNRYTLPLTFNPILLREFNEAVSTILTKGDYILIYPEQAMWWNYTKPRPMRTGGFKFAVENNVPVLPCFVTLKERGKKDQDGYPMYSYTLHILPPIYPDLDLDKNKAIEKMKEENETMVKEIYETTYQIPLVYNVK